VTKLDDAENDGEIKQQTAHIELRPFIARLFFLQQFFMYLPVGRFIEIFLYQQKGLG